MAEPRVKAGDVKCPTCKKEAGQLCVIVYRDVHDLIIAGQTMRMKKEVSELHELVGTPLGKNHHERIAQAAAWSKKKGTVMKQKVMFDGLAQLECRVCGMRVIGPPRDGKCSQCKNVNSLFHCSEEAKKEALRGVLGELDNVIGDLEGEP